MTGPAALGAAAASGAAPGGAAARLLWKKLPIRSGSPNCSACGIVARIIRVE